MGLPGGFGHRRAPDHSGTTTGAAALEDMDGIDFATALIERAHHAGADAAQAAHVATEQFELDADTGGVNLVATRHGDSTTLTVFRDDRRGTAELTGRDETAVDAVVRNALDAAEAARPDPANAIETMASGNFQDLILNIRAVSKESIDLGGGAFPYLAASGVTISRP